MTPTNSTSPIAITAIRTYYRPTPRDVALILSILVPLAYFMPRVFFHLIR